jgi:5-methylcytosine-specific restriction endonuclease McrA
LNSFENCVSSCQSCNSKKADRTPKEANMQLRSIPRPITKAQKILLEIKTKRYPDEWKPYVDIQG